MTINSMSFKLVRFLIATMIALVGAVSAAAMTAAPAQALCAAQPMEGNWRNINSGTKAITRVNVGFTCGDVRSCDTDGNCTGGQSFFTVRTFGKCSPTDCDWGARRAATMSDGWQRATYSHSWATKYVWIKTYVFGSTTYLRVYTWTDFTDGRSDYSTDEWMRS